MIRYKVVTDDRKSMNRSCGSYELEYIRETKVFGKEGTLGVFCFKTKKDATEFILANEYTRSKYGLRILRVRPIGRGKVPKYVLSGNIQTSILVDDYTDSEPPKGTICYPAVEVLD